MFLHFGPFLGERGAYGGRTHPARQVNISTTTKSIIMAITKKNLIVKKYKRIFFFNIIRTFTETSLCKCVTSK